MSSGGEGASNMDKKPTNRQSCAPAKLGAADTKKSENNNGNKFPRNNRKKEPQNSRPRYDSPHNRKPAPQKSRALDKRPRSRGYADDRYGNEVATEYGAEVGSALKSGSKKANLNHLLGFTFAPRDAVCADRHGRPASRNKWGYKKVRYNKEQYLQANCQFVVRDCEDFKVHFGDPDVLVDWELIERVHIFSHEMPSCPICLYPPTAARITRCGHIYCWSCLLHYLSLGEKHWRKCPICYEAVHQKDLKSVVCLPTRQYAVGEDITMRLMKRERGSTYAVPKSQWTDRNCKPHLYGADDVDTSFLKILTVSENEIMNFILSERETLNRQLKEEGEASLEGSFVSAALAQLESHEKALFVKSDVKAELASMVEKLRLSSDGTSDEGSKTNEKTPQFKKDVVQYASAFSDEEDNDTDPPVEQTSKALNENKVESTEVEESDNANCHLETEHATDSPTTRSCDTGMEMPVEVAAEELALPGDTTPGRDSATASSRSMTDIYYFFQAADGQHIYMNSLNARCLIKENGGLEYCPDTITANIVELEDISMTEELRRRLRYLNHLPLTCEFQVAELALKPPILSRETIRFFGDEIDRRRRVRQRKQREERKHSKKIQDEENKKMGIFPAMKSHLESGRHFPQCTNEEDAQPNIPASPVSSTVLSSSGSTPLDTPVGSPPGLNPHAAEFMPHSPTSSHSDDSTAPMSFAQMLRAGKAKPVAWGHTAKAEVCHAPELKKKADSDDSDPEDLVPVPIFRESFGSAIQKALDEIAANPGVKVQVEEPSPPSGKKKKKVKKLLFTTTMNRSK